VSDRTNASVGASDSRYRVNVTIDDQDEFTLFYNPGNPFVLKHAEAMQNIDLTAGMTSAAVDEIEAALDGIFGEGITRKIFNYDGPGFPLMNAIVEKVTEGIQDYTEKAAAIEKDAKTKALIEANKSAAPYIAPGS